MLCDAGFPKPETLGKSQENQRLPLTDMGWMNSERTCGWSGLLPNSDWITSSPGHEVTTYSLHCSSFFWFLNQIYNSDPIRQPQKGTTMETTGKCFFNPNGLKPLSSTFYVWWEYHRRLEATWTAADLRTFVPRSLRSNLMRLMRS